MWWHTVTHGRGKWRGNWRMEWVASTLHATSEHGVSNITTADAHTSAASSRLNWRPTAYLNGLVRLVSARVPSHFKRSLPTTLQSAPSLCTNILYQLGILIARSPKFILNFPNVICLSLRRAFLWSGFEPGSLVTLNSRKKVSPFTKKKSLNFTLHFLQAAPFASYHM